VFGEFVNAAKTLRGKIEGRLKIGIVMLSPELLRLGEFMRDMVVTHKALSIALEVGRIGWLIDAVISGDIDGALYTGRALPKDTCGVELERLTFRVVAPAVWKNRLQNATWSDAALMPWIRTTQPSAHHEMVSDILRQTSIKPVEIVEADHEFIIRALVTAGVGIGLMREDLAIAAQNAGEVMILGEEKAFTMLSFIYHANRQHDPAIQAAVAVLRKIWGLSA
jgi:DNA-binding transcriptional LysR family regulator